MEKTINEKKCSKCKEIKTLDLFGVKKYNKDGLNHYCLNCERERLKLRYSNPVEKDKKKYYQIFKLYGLNKSQYITKLEKQNFKCTICGSELKNDNKTHIDHCHITGVIRDILCGNCNNILGKVNEDIEYLNNLINYINRFGKSDSIKRD